jgi:hypothetical protein
METIRKSLTMVFKNSAFMRAFQGCVTLVEEDATSSSHSKYVRSGRKFQVFRLFWGSFRDTSSRMVDPFMMPNFSQP